MRGYGANREPQSGAERRALRIALWLNAGLAGSLVIAGVIADSSRMRWTFSINDLLANLGVLAAGRLVAWLGRAWPDVVVGLAIALLAAKGGIEILSDARRAGPATAS